MKINVDFRGLPGLYRTLNKRKEIAVEFPGRTLRDLIDRLVGEFGAPMENALLDGHGDIDMEIRVALNREAFLTENRMETILNDGDTIAFIGATWG